MNEAKMNERERERMQAMNDVVEAIEKIHRLNVEMYEYMERKRGAIAQDGNAPLDGEVDNAKREHRSSLTHRMNLNPEPFDSIKNGRKNVEMRLNDEKRRLIERGDLILFTETETKEELHVKVQGRAEYPDFHELYANYDKVSIGYKEDEVASPDDMLEYYPPEKIKKYGALAILISLDTEDA